MASRPIMVMGKGSGRKDLEHCPPVEHFELTEDELAYALKDPAGVAERLGLDVPDAIHVRGRTGVGVQKLAADAADGGVDGGADAGAGTVYCCIRCLYSSWCCTAWPAGSVPHVSEITILSE